MEPRIRPRSRDRRSSELRDKDRIPRQLIYEAVAFGFHARLFYLADDSFFLEWVLPDNEGSRYETNPEAVMFSFRYCVQQLTEIDPGLEVRTHDPKRNTGSQSARARAFA